MDIPETEAVLRAIYPIVRSLGGRLLVGALHPDAAEARRAIAARVDLIADIAGNPIRFKEVKGNIGAAASACATLGIPGFAVCAPAGQGKTQEEIFESLDMLLGDGLPMALYQLPQVTKNEISPETFARLAARHPNLYLFKDTSGSDKIALADIDRAGVFFVRGAEGEFSRWIAKGTNPNASFKERRYDGFLLSSANVFGKELAEMIHLARSGKESAASAISGKMTRVVSAVFAQAAKLPYGNAFSNANRALDHARAWAEKSTGGAIVAPRTHCGERLPESLLRFAMDALVTEGFSLPAYLDSRNAN
jgi:dihydrodipicolinate synthase/N-acetylneuraminate lyase